MSFADLEARVNASVIGRAWNATASLNSGDAVDVIFDAAFAVADVGLGVESSAPVVMLATANVPASPHGKSVVVAGTAFTIAQHQPDGTGMSVLLLERAA